MKEEAEQKAREEAAKEEAINKEQQIVEKPVKKGPQPGYTMLLNDLSTSLTYCVIRKICGVDYRTTSAN